LVVGAFGELLLRVVGYQGAFSNSKYKMNGITNRDHLTFDSVAGYALIPNIRDHFRGVSTDAFGNRITSRSTIRHDRSIVLVGDSSMFGWGVTDEDTFAFKLANDPRFSEFNIVNTAVPSYSVAHIVAVLKHKVQLYNPALIIVGVSWPWKAFEAIDEYGSANGWRSIDFEFYKQLYPVRDTFKDTLAPKWYRMRLPTLVRDLYFRTLYGKKIRENMTTPGVRDFTLTKEQEEHFAAQHVTALREAVGQLPASTKVMFYVYPYQYTIFHEEFKHLGEAGYQVLLSGLDAPDLKPLIRQAFVKEPLYIDGGHLTPTGHDVFARLLGDMAVAKLK
jgi:hypothetical protein